MTSVTENSEELLSGVHKGQYPIIRKTGRGDPVVDFGKTIGDFKSNGNLVGSTQYGKISYGKNGAHIVPANPNQY